MPAQHQLVELPQRRDPRGVLLFAQQPDQIPFTPKRVFVIYPEGDAQRGAHAHRAQHQFLVMLAGSALVTVDNGVSRVKVALDRPTLALHAPPMLWLELDDFTTAAVCMVLTSDVYSESDYIRDRAEFLRLAR